MSQATCTGVSLLARHPKLQDGGLSFLTSRIELCGHSTPKKKVRKAKSYKNTNSLVFSGCKIMKTNLKPDIPTGAGAFCRQAKARAEGRSNCYLR